MAQVQTKTGFVTATTSGTITATNNYAGGNMLLLVSEDNFGDGTATRISSVSDGSNAWSRLTGISTGGNMDLEIWAAYNCAGGAHPTITVSYANSLSSSLILAEYNLIGSSAFDKSAAATGTSTAPASGNTTALSQARELVIGVVGWGVTTGFASNPITGYGNLVQEQNGSGANTNSALADKIVNTDTAQSVAMTLNIVGSEWGCIVLTFNMIPSRQVNRARPRPFAPGIAR